MKFFKRYILLILLFLLFVGLLFVFLKNFNNKEDYDRPLVITTFYPLEFFAESLLRDKVIVKSIVPSNIEPHDYEPSLKDLVKLNKASLIILNGGGIDAKIERAINTLKYKNKKKNIFIVEREISFLDYPNSTIKDPHFWLDPLKTKDFVNKLSRVLLNIFPEYSSKIEKNRLVLLSKLDKLIQNYDQVLSNCKLNTLIVYHNAFNYWHNRYGLDIVSLSGNNPNQETSLHKVEQIIKLIKKKNIKFIFAEAIEGSNLLQTIAQETGSQIKVLDPIEGIKNLGDDYFRLMYKNLKNLQEALSCLE